MLVASSVVVLYDSLLLADYALMRHNDPYIEHVRGPDRILLLSSARNAGRAGGHNPSRPMDPVVLVYSVIRGLFWIARGYEWYGTVAQARPLGKHEIQDIIQDLIKELGCDESRSLDTPGLLVDLIVCLWRRGLLHLTPCKQGSFEGDTMPVRALLEGFKAEPNDYLTLKRLAISIHRITGRDVEKLEDLSLRVLEKLANVLQLDEGGSGQRVIPCFKSLHGLIIREVYNAKSLPDRYTIADVTLLPLIIEPRGLIGEASYNGVKIPASMSQFLEEACNSDGDRLAAALEDAMESAGVNGLNRYQERFIDEYFSSRIAGHIPWGLLTAPTGAGKTLAFTLVALAEVLAGKCRGGKPLAVLAYPRKTLERQQLLSLASLIYHVNRSLEASGLGGYTITLMVRDGQSPSPRELGDAADHRISIPGIGYDWRHRVENVDGLQVYYSSPGWLIDVKVSRGLVDPGRKPLWRAPDILVTNYNMIYRMLLFNTGKGGLADRLLSDLRILVLDEAHLLSGEEGYTIQAPMLLLSNRRRDYGLIVSSATISTLDTIPGGVSTTHVLGVIPCRTPATASPSSIIEQVTGLQAGDRHVIYIDYYSDYACRIAEEQSSLGRPVLNKKTIWAIIAPSTERSPETAVLEAFLSSIHILAALRGKTGERYKSLAFIEVKSTLKDITGKFVGRFIIELGEVYDRVLLTQRFFDIVKKEHGHDNRFLASHSSYRYILKPMGDMLSKGCRLSDVIWDLCGRGTYFSDYHNITAYIDDKTLPLLNARLAMEEAARVIEQVIRHATSYLEPPDGGIWIDLLRQQAKAMLEEHAWEEDQGTARYLDKWKGPHLLLYHHGDIKRYRSLMDKALEEGHTPLLIVATSTLEVGLNLDGVLYTMHFRVPHSNSRIVQEVGRSGRDLRSLLTSMGIVFVRHNAWETPKRIERHAIDYFINVKVPETVRLADNPLALARLAATLGEADPSVIAPGGASLEASRIILLKRNIEFIISSSRRLSGGYRSASIALQSLADLIGTVNDHIMDGTLAHYMRQAKTNLEIITSGIQAGGGLTPLDLLYLAVDTWNIMGEFLRVASKRLDTLDQATAAKLKSEIQGHIASIQGALEDIITRVLVEASNITGLSLQELTDSLIPPSKLSSLSFSSKKGVPLGVTVLGEP